MPRHKPTSVMQLSAVLIAASLWVGLAGLFVGAGEPMAWRETLWLMAELRGPRTLGAWLAGACLGLAGAVAQGLFRNPLADPYLLGSAAGAGLGVTAVLTLGGLGGLGGGWLLAPGWMLQASLTSGAFVGAWVGVLGTLLLARGAAHPLRVLLAGVVVGVLAAALSDLLALWGPVSAWRARQAFMMGSTSLLSWASVQLLGLSLALTLLLTLPAARVLDALTLGDAAARSLGLAVARWRTVLMAGMALSTGTVVAQAGLIAFVGLAAPHLVRQRLTTTQGPVLGLSALSGGLLLAGADVLARALTAPRELPVGLITAVLGGVYLLVLLHRAPRSGP